MSSVIWDLSFVSAVLALCILVGGCATRKQPPSPPALPPTAETAVKVLANPPRVGYDKLGTVTILQNAGEPVDQSFQTVRKIAAQLGANAVFVQQDRAYKFRNGAGRRIQGRMTVYSVVYVR